MATGAVERRSFSPGDAVNGAAWIMLPVIVAACFWSGARPWMFVGLAAVIAVATVLDIVLIYKSPVRGTDVDANQGRFFLTSFAPLVLALAAMYRFELVDWQLPLLVAAALGLPIAAMQGL
jgi:hypothetical protein